jgi:hypothetical protein
MSAELELLRAELDETRRQLAAAQVAVDADAAHALTVALDDWTLRSSHDSIRMCELRGYARVWQIVSVWSPALDGERRLGDVRKVLPPDEDVAVTIALRMGFD